MLLATCFDEAALSIIKQLEGKNVRLDVDATGAVTATESAVPSATEGAVPKSGGHQPVYVQPCMGIPSVGQAHGFQSNGQDFEAKPDMPKPPRPCILLSKDLSVVLSCAVLYYHCYSFPSDAAMPKSWYTVVVCCSTCWTATHQGRADSNCYRGVPLTWAVQFLTLVMLTAEAYRPLFICFCSAAFSSS